MDMDPRGNLYVGGRDAVYLFEADGKGGFKARRTITTLPQDTWAYSLQVAGDDLYVLTVTALYRLPNVIRDPGKVTFERLVWGIPLGHIHQGFHGMKMGPDGGLYLAFGDPHQLSDSHVKSLLASESPIVQLAGLRAADG